MKSRMVYPNLWVDSTFQDLTRLSKLLFLYLITCPHISLTRYTNISDKQIIFDTDLNKEELGKCKRELHDKRLVLFHETWQYHVHELSYVDYKGIERVNSAKEKELDSIPDEIKLVFNQLLTSSELVLNYKSETINPKSEIKTQELVITKPHEAQEIIDLWNEKFGRHYKLTDKLKESYKVRRANYSVDDLKTAVFNLSLSDFHTGKNDRKWEADPAWLLRNDDNVQKALNLQPREEKKRKVVILT